MRLTGGLNQAFGGVQVIRTDSAASELLARLRGMVGPFGLDTETVGVDPTCQSSAFRGRAVFWSLAWANIAGLKHTVAGVPLCQRAFLWAAQLPVFKEWLLTAPIVGQNITGFDMHILENMGITLGNVVGDTKHMSRLWYASKDISHGLKDQAREILGYDMTDYGLFARSTELKPKVYKSSRTVVRGGVSVTTAAGAWPCFSWGKRSGTSYKRQLIDLDVMETDYPQLMERMYDYASLDAKACLELYYVRQRQLHSRIAKAETTMQLHDRVWHPGVLMLQRMERSGMLVDVDLCRAGEAAAAADCKVLDLRLNEYFKAEVAWGSSQQLVALFKSLRLPRPPIEGTLKAISKASNDKEFPTAEASIYWLETKCPEYAAGLKLLRDWRKRRKLGQYLRDLPGYVAPDGRLHTCLSPEADTGRLSARNPALQQLPSADNDPYGIRRAFVAGPGRKLVVSDFSQLEVYVLAHIIIKLGYGGDLYRMLLSGDVYTAVARTVWPSETRELSDADIKNGIGKKWRKLAKVLVLSSNYGKSAMGLALSLLDESGEPSTEEYAAELLRLYFERMPGVAKYQQWVSAYAATHGGTPSLLGRWRPLPLAMSTTAWEARRGARQALNGPVQAGAQDIATLAMLGMNTYKNIPGYWNEALASTGARVLLPIHDEVVLDVPENCADSAATMVTYSMEHPNIDLCVQLKCVTTIADDWGSAK